MRCARITTTMKMGPAAVKNMSTIISAAVVGKNTTITNMVMLKVVADMSTVMSRNTSTAMTKRAAAAKLILMKGMNMMPAAVKNMSTIITVVVVVMNMSTTTNISMAKAVGVGNITMNTKKAAAADMNIITVTTFRVTRMTVSAKSAIRMKNTATCAAKALKTVPAVCRTLTA